MQAAKTGIHIAKKIVRVITAGFFELSFAKSFSL